MTEIAYGSEHKGPSSEQQKVILEKAKERIPEPVYTLLLDYIVKTLEANYMHLDGCTSTEVAICAILLYLTEGKSQRVFQNMYGYPKSTLARNTKKFAKMLECWNKQFIGWGSYQIRRQLAEDCLLHLKEKYSYTFEQLPDLLATTLIVDGKDLRVIFHPEEYSMKSDKKTNAMGWYSYKTMGAAQRLVVFCDLAGFVRYFTTPVPAAQSEIKDLKQELSTISKNIDPNDVIVADSAYYGVINENLPGKWLIMGVEKQAQEHNMTLPQYNELIKFLRKRIETEVFGAATNKFRIWQDKFRLNIMFLAPLIGFTFATMNAIKLLDYIPETNWPRSWIGKVPRIREKPINIISPSQEAKIQQLLEGTHSAALPAQTGKYDWNLMFANNDDATDTEHEKDDEKPKSKKRKNRENTKPNKRKKTKDV